MGDKPNFAIMRIEKIKSGQAMGKALDHNCRTAENPAQNIDTARSDQNLYWTKATGAIEGEQANSSKLKETRQTAFEKYKNMLPDKVRSNAVVGSEFFFQSSEEPPDGDFNYFDRCIEWTKKIVGEDNLLAVAIHNDETSPHLHIITGVIVDGKLNARALFGGKRDRMAELQDDFYDFAGRPSGLDRGISREETRARHNAHTLENKVEEINKNWEYVEAAKFGVKQAWSDLDSEKKIVAGITQHLHDLDNQEREQFWSEYKERSPIFLEVCKSVAVEKVAAAREQQVDRRQPQQTHGKKI